MAKKNPIVQHLYYCVHFSGKQSLQVLLITFFLGER